MFIVSCKANIYEYFMRGFAGFVGTATSF